MFSLDRAKVKIIAVTAISELHGNERKPACCITFEMIASSLYLSEFDSALRGMLYSKETQPTKQGALDIDEELGGLTALRFPKMGAPIKWDWDGAGYTAILHIGASGKGDIELGDADLKNIQFTPKDGGSCVYKWQVMAHPTAKEQGQIDQMLQSETELSLLEPTAEPDLLDDKAATTFDPFHGSDLSRNSAPA